MASFHFLLSLLLGSFLLRPGLGQTCQITLPNNPFSPTSMSTPWVVNGCTQSDPGQATFVQGGIVSGTQIFIYNPLLINAGQPFVAPVVPTLPPNATVAFWFGTNAGAVQLLNKDPSCVDGFGQFAYCNAPHFFAAAAAVPIPPIGVAADGYPCPTTRDFTIVDQDPSDNVNTLYLLTPNGQIMADTTANRQAHPDAIELINASDEHLLEVIDIILNCNPFMAADIGDGNKFKAALFLNEMSAAKWQQPPVALVPDLDPMVTTNGAPDRNKMNLYRAGVNQPPDVDADTATFCKNLANATPRMQAQKPFFTGKPSPDPATGIDLFTFLANRLDMTWANLNCPALTGITSIVTVGLDAAGVAVNATYLQNAPACNQGILYPTGALPTVPVITTIAGVFMAVVAALVAITAIYGLHRLYFTHSRQTGGQDWKAKGNEAERLSPMLVPIAVAVACALLRVAVATWQAISGVSALDPNNTQLGMVILEHFTSATFFGALATAGILTSIEFDQTSWPRPIMLFLAAVQSVMPWFLLIPATPATRVPTIVDTIALLCRLGIAGAVGAIVIYGSYHHQKQPEKFNARGDVCINAILPLTVAGALRVTMLAGGVAASTPFDDLVVGSQLLTDPLLQFLLVVMLEQAPLFLLARTLPKIKNAGAWERSVVGRNDRGGSRAVVTVFLLVIVLVTCWAGYRIAGTGNTAALGWPIALANAGALGSIPAQIIAFLTSYWSVMTYFRRLASGRAVTMADTAHAHNIAGMLWIATSILHVVGHAVAIGSLGLISRAILNTCVPGYAGYADGFLSNHPPVLLASLTGILLVLSVVGIGISGFALASLRDGSEAKTKAATTLRTFGFNAASRFRPFGLTANEAWRGLHYISAILSLLTLIHGAARMISPIPVTPVAAAIFLFVPTIAEYFFRLSDAMKSIVATGTPTLVPSTATAPEIVAILNRLPSIATGIPSAAGGKETKDAAAKKSKVAPDAFPLSKAPKSPRPASWRVTCNLIVQIPERGAELSALGSDAIVLQLPADMFGTGLARSSGCVLRLGIGERLGLARVFPFVRVGKVFECHMTLHARGWTERLLLDSALGRPVSIKVSTPILAASDMLQGGAFNTALVFAAGTGTIQGLEAIARLSAYPVPCNVAAFVAPSSLLQALRVMAILSQYRETLGVVVFKVPRVKPSQQANFTTTLRDLWEREAGTAETAATTGRLEAPTIARPPTSPSAFVSPTSLISPKNRRNAPLSPSTTTTSTPGSGSGTRPNTALIAACCNAVNVTDRLILTTEHFNKEQFISAVRAIRAPRAEVANTVLVCSAGQGISTFDNAANELQAGAPSFHVLHLPTFE